MKASELMIGDWVKDSTHCNVRFDGIGCSDYNEINRNNGYPIRCDDEDDRYVGIINSEQKRTYNEHLADLQPIPLTEEILKANGILYQFGCPWWQKADPFGNHNQYEVHINNVTTVIVDYVHQLQHALRLCGLNKLADNFKVE